MPAPSFKSPLRVSTNPIADHTDWNGCASPSKPWKSCSTTRDNEDDEALDGTETPWSDVESGTEMSESRNLFFIDGVMGHHLIDAQSVAGPRQPAQNQSIHSALVTESATLFFYLSRH